MNKQPTRPTRPATLGSSEVVRRPQPARMPDPSQPFHTLADAEKKAVWALLNAPVNLADLRPLTAAEAAWSVTGRGVKSVLVGVEKGLLAEADAHAKSPGLTLHQFIAAGLRVAMAAGVTADTLDA